MGKLDGGYGSTRAYREEVGGERSGGGLGKFTIAGRVVDVDGNAVVGKLRGEFWASEKNNLAAAIQMGFGAG